MEALRHFREVWLIDFEFSAPDGERPEVVCLVAREFFTGRLLRLFADELSSEPPFRTDESALFVAYFSCAEWDCFLALGWELPVRILDLWTEHRLLTNGISGVQRGLLHALGYYGLDSIEAVEKEEMRELAMRGLKYTATERVSLLDYCESDVNALAKLLPVMLPRLDLPRALLRGRYMPAVSRMQHTGVPIDVETLQRFRDSWEDIQERLIKEVDSQYGVFEGRTFKHDRFADWLTKRGIPWPRTECDRLALDDDTFRQQARKYPEVSALRELRHALSELRLEKLAVGSDGRNRCLLSPFSSRTGRNQPSNNKFIFGTSVWLRGLIQPAEGQSVAYIDFSQQELGIAAALSRDNAMLRAYESGDPYLAFAKQAGAVPSDATKDSHPVERNRFKVCSLAVQYGMGAESLALSLNEPRAVGRYLLQSHRDTYRDFWKWSQRQVDVAMLTGEIRTVFGWRLLTSGEANPRSLANFPMQANGAEMLRLACSMVTEAGIRVCAPVHDAVLVEAATEDVRGVVEHTQAIMAKASRDVLGGFALTTDAEIIDWPNRYMDEKRGATMWAKVSKLTEQNGTQRPNTEEPFNGPQRPTRTVL